MADELDTGVTIRGMRLGQSVFGRYTLAKILGRGGMGVVWLARDEKLERDVALKFLPEVIMGDKTALGDLKRETRRSLDLTHPHVVRIYDFVQDQRTAAIAMEYVPGETLGNARAERPHRCFEPAELEKWAAQLCEALSYAHTKAQVVHRDLKPANLMIDARGDLKVMDFGVASSIADSVSRVSVQAGTSGTPVYMSPQQMMGEKPSASDDIYALGATLYDLLTGKPPFYTGNVIVQVQSKVPPSIVQRRIELGMTPAETSSPVPPAWESTVAACLAKEPRDRPASVAQVAARLGLAGASRLPEPTRDPALATAPSQPETPESLLPPQKTRSRWGIILALAVGVAAMAVAGWWLGLRVPEQRRLAEVARQEAAAQETAAAEAARVQRELREQAEAARQAQQKAEREQQAQGAILAKIDTFADGAPVALGEQVEAAVSDYLAQAPAHFHDEVVTRWQNRRAAWEAARLAAARGSLVVRTDPPGAQVRVGSMALDQSPLTLSDQRLGIYPVLVQLGQHEDWSGEVEVKENTLAELDVGLVRSTGTLQLTSEPSGLAYTLHGELKQEGRTPAELTLPTGAYEVTFRRDGWPDETRAGEVKRRENTPLSATFPAGSLELSSTPSGAEVWLDGEQVGRTPYRRDDAVPGRYNYELRNPGFVPSRVPLTVAAQKVTRDQVALEAEVELRDVILYREARLLNSGASYHVSWQGQRLGYLHNGTVLRVRLPPGNQTLDVGYMTNQLRGFQHSIMVADQGETYVFFRMKFSASDHPRSHMTIVPVPASAGRAAVAKLGK